MPIETVLLVVSNEDSDHLEQVTETALEIAAPLDATVVIGHAIPEHKTQLSNAGLPVVGSRHPYVLSQNEYDDLLEEFDGETVDDVAASHDTVQTAAELVADAGVEYRIRGVVGDPSEALVTLADESDADRLVLGGHHRSPTEKVVFGSVAQTVLLESPCPVTFVRDD